VSVAAAYRRTGADLPWSDPRPTHGAQMEGWFWRFTDASHGRVLVVLCGVNRHPDGDWATVAIASHPGRRVASACVDDAVASPDRFAVRAGDAFEAGPAHVSARVGDDEVDVRIQSTVPWPLRLGGGGVFSALPWLGQYWHPHALGGRASGTARVAGETWALDGATVYAEKNWGAGFPDRWWWGQADTFEPTPAEQDVCVAFGGGRLRAGPAAIDVTGCVVRIDQRVIRFAPPTALVRAHIGEDTWRVRARRRGWRVELDGHGGGQEPHVLPVPVPAERHNVHTDYEHLAGTLDVRVHHRGAVVFAGRSALAGLEIGSV